MTDNRIEKIRAEIERLKHQSVIDSDRQAERGLQSASMASFGKVKACEELLSFIDSMQKEPKECMYSKDNYTDEDRKVLCDGCEEECIFNKKEESINNGLDLGCGVIWKDEEPVIEPQVKESAKTQHVNKTCKEKGNSLTQKSETIDFEQELYKYFGQVKDFTLGIRIAKRFYEIGKKHQESVSEDLEKAAEQDVCEAVNTCSAIGIPNDHIPSWVQDAMVNEFIHGAQWKDKQLMAKAVDITVHIDAGGYPYVDRTIELYDYDREIPLAKKGDKVKIIVIKQE